MRRSTINNLCEIGLLLLILLVAMPVSGQISTPCSDALELSFPDELCLNDPITFSPPQTNVTFDFCPGELLNAPVLNGDIDLSQVSKIRGLKFVEDSGEWFGFVTSRDNNVILRLEYGNSLENIPSITNLGNLNGLFSNPESIDIIQWNGEWYGFVHNTNAANIGVVQLNFGVSLTNIPSAVLLESGVGTALSSLKLINEAGDLHIVLSNFSINTLTVLRIGDPGNSTVESVFTTSPLPQTSGMTDISLVKTCGTWKALLTVFNSRTAKWLEFSSGIMSDPEVTDIGFNAFNGFRPYNGRLIYENNTLYSTITTFNGTVFKLSFDSDNPPVSTAWTSVGNYSDNVRIATLVQQGSTWEHYFVNESSGQLSRAVYPENCDVATPVADENTIMDVRFDSGGYKNFTYSGYLPDGTYYSQKDSIYYYQAPTAVVGLTSGCIGQEALFTSEVTFEFGNSVTYNWNFDDPGSGENTATIPEPSHVFSGSGAYNVSLTVTDECGVSTTEIKPITIYPAGEITPDFSTAALVCSNQSIQFTDESDPGNDIITSWLWDFDGLGQSTENTPSFTFSEPGDYIVSLQVGGEFNCYYTVAKTVSVIEGPNPSFTVDDACQGTTMQFNNTSTGQVDSYFWDFGNGITSTLENPEIEFDNDGQYLVALTLTNSAGCVSQFTQSVTVYATPTVSFANELACERTPTLFRDESFANNANIVAWAWDFGDPDSENNTATIQEPSHIFSSAGTYDVSLTVTTNFGCQSTSVQQVIVLESPTAAFSYDQACIGESISFQDNSFPPAGESITSWAWDLGGTFSSQRNPTATFDFARSYDITLVVTASNQCIARETQEIIIADPPVIQMGIQQPCLGNPVTFIDFTSSPMDPVISRTWDFGGLGLSSDSIASFTFPNSGRYQVTLETVLASGCTFSRTQAVDIDPAPEASFTIDRTFGPPPFTINAQSTSQNTASLVWLLDGEIISVDNSLNYLLDEVGDYELALVASSSAGCLDTARQMIQVTDPELDISVSDLLVTFNAPPDNGDHFVTLEFTVQNQGTLDLTSLPVTIVFDADYEITQEIEVDLPADNSPVKVNLPVQIALRLPLNICVKVPEMIYGVPDEDPSNNSACFSESLVVTYAPYPNPASERVNFDILSTSDQPVEIDVYSSSGTRKFSSTVATGRSGLETLTLDTSSWAAGTYILQFRTPEGMTYYRFVIQH